MITYLELNKEKLVNDKENSLNFLLLLISFSA